MPAIREMAEASVWQPHRDACDRGQHSYVDPDSGYLVFTRIGLLAREKCRGAGCRHCPYAHENVELPARTVKMHQAAWLPETRPPGDRDTGVLFWSGGKDSFLAYRATERDGDLALVLLTTFDGATGFIAHQDLHIDTVVEQARRLGRLFDALLLPCVFFAAGCCFSGFRFRAPHREEALLLHLSN